MTSADLRTMPPVPWPRRNIFATTLPLIIFPTRHRALTQWRWKALQRRATATTDITCPPRHHGLFSVKRALLKARELRDSDLRHDRRIKARWQLTGDRPGQRPQRNTQATRRLPRPQAARAVILARGRGHLPTTCRARAWDWQKRQTMLISRRPACGQQVNAGPQVPSAGISDWTKAGLQAERVITLFTLELRRRLSISWRLPQIHACADHDSGFNRQEQPRPADLWCRKDA